MATRRFYQAGHHMAERPPSVLSPFAQHRCYRRWGDVCHLLGRRYPSFIAPTGSCATPVGLSPPSAFNLVKESLQVLRSPCCPRELPDVISESPSLNAGSRSPALHVCSHLFLPQCHRPSPSEDWVGSQRLSHE